MRTIVRAILILYVAASIATAFGDDPPTKKGKAKAKADAKAKGESTDLDPFGRPEGSIHDQTARYYVWYDGNKWSLRTTAKGVRNFHGTIRVKDAKIKSCLSVGLKNDKKQNDAWRFNDDRNELKFQFKTSTLADGFDLDVDGDNGQIEFELFIDDQKRPRDVFVGRDVKHPPGNPFTLPAAPKKMK